MNNGATTNGHTSDGNTSNRSSSNGNTSNRNTGTGTNFLNGWLPTIAANGVRPNIWNISIRMEDDGLLEPAVYARHAPGTGTHNRHSDIRSEMVELLDGTTPLTTPPDGRFGAIGSEIFGKA